MPGPLVWIDCEMTGLNPQTDRILEISCFVTDGQLQLLDTNGYTNVVHYSTERLAQMDEWCQTTHSRTGLIKRVLASTNTKEQVEQELLAYLQPMVERGMGVLAGNTVHMDRAFMMNEFPELTNYLHYRIVDVSSIKEIGYRHNPGLMAQVPRKKLDHTARSDILESIEELRWYYTHYLKSPSDSSSQDASGTCPK